MEYTNNPNRIDSKVKEIQSMLNRALDNAILLLKADFSLPSLLGDSHCFQTLHHRNYIPNGWVKISEDGRFGNETEKAVKSFQEFWYITINGIVGRTTYDYLSKLASINECSVRIMGKPLQISSKNTRNDDSELLHRFIESIEVTGNNLCKQLIDLSISFFQNMIGQMSVNWMIGQMRNKFLTNMDVIKASSFLDLLKTRNAGQMYQSKGVITNSIRGGISSKSIRMSRNNAQKSIKINKVGNAGGFFMAVILAFSKVITMIFNYQDSEEWEKICKKECYIAIESVIFGSIASVILKTIIFAITGGTTTTMMVTGAATGAAVGTPVGGVGAIPGSAIGAVGGSLIGVTTGITIVYVSINIITFLVECLLVTLISLCLSSLFKFIAEVADIKEPFKKNIFEPVFDSMMIPLKKNFNDNR